MIADKRRQPPPGRKTSLIPPFSVAEKEGRSVSRCASVLCWMFDDGRHFPLVFKHIQEVSVAYTLATSDFPAHSHKPCSSRSSLRKSVSSFHSPLTPRSSPSTFFRHSPNFPSHCLRYSSNTGRFSGVSAITPVSMPGISDSPDARE